jgi:hypothetical protein
MAGAFEFAYNLDGSNASPIIKKFPIAASQTLKIGDPVVIASNQVTKGGNGFGRCLGVMAEAVTTPAANTMVAVYVAQPGQVWRAKASADATTYVLGSRAFDLDSNLKVNVADTTGGCMEIVELGATNTDVNVIFAATELGA